MVTNGEGMCEVTMNDKPVFFISDFQVPYFLFGAVLILVAWNENSSLNGSKNVYWSQGARYAG
jgi:hypothetical protein